jgi:hypothetical protein
MHLNIGHVPHKAKTVQAMEKELVRAGVWNNVPLTFFTLYFIIVVVFGYGIIYRLSHPVINNKFHPT